MDIVRFDIVLGNGGNISKNRTGKVFVYKQTFCYLNTPSTETKKPLDSEPVGDVSAIFPVNLWAYDTQA